MQNEQVKSVDEDRKIIWKQVDLKPSIWTQKFVQREIWVF
jgi:hypothetical protein